MFESTRDFFLRDIYSFVAVVERYAQQTDTFCELGLEDTSELALRLQKPHKLSLLQEYIFAVIRIERTSDYSKNADLYNMDDAEQLVRVFEEYQISLTNNGPWFSDSENCESFYGWFRSNEDAFLEYWEKVADEVFHIIFSNRRFLLQFGLSLAEYLTKIQHLLPKAILSDTGRIERFNRIPAWLKKAVFCRDHGRCTFCKVDLSGLIATDRRLNFDHIVPLARWGSNDPSNFQLLCEECNLKKSDSPGQVGRNYAPWWDY